jgi:hypothetical protein
VSLLNPTSIKIALPNGVAGTKWTVRMETPVLYFYSPQRTTVRARVAFRDGIITEWYPQSTAAGQWIDWPAVDITPGVMPALPVDAVNSHYYAARETDAAPVNVGGQQEKFLFYRGLANFRVPVSATLTANNTVEVKSDVAGIPTLVLFESDGVHAGYRLVRNAAMQTTIERPPLTSSVESLRRDLQSVLVEQGLYPREALAMVNTWRDSWFEKGTRLFYWFPRSAVDAILPLQIDPKPAEVVRVFVGRLDIITPAIMADVDRAIRTKNTRVLTSYGRFLEPIADQILARPSFNADPVSVRASLRDVAQSLTARPKSCVPTRLPPA